MAKIEKLIKQEETCNIKDYTLCGLGVFIVFGFFFIEYLVVTGQIIADNDTNVTTVLNYSNSLVIFVAGYFFGSSKASGDKDKAIADMATASMGTGPGQVVTTVTKTAATVPPVAPVGPLEVVNAPDTTLKVDPATEPVSEPKKD